MFFITDNRRWRAQPPRYAEVIFPGVEFAYTAPSGMGYTPTVAVKPTSTGGVEYFGATAFANAQARFIWRTGPFANLCVFRVVGAANDGSYALALSSSQFNTANRNGPELGATGLITTGVRNRIYALVRNNSQTSNQSLIYSPDTTAFGRWYAVAHYSNGAGTHTIRVLNGPEVSGSYSAEPEFNTVSPLSMCVSGSHASVQSQIFMRLNWVPPAQQLDDLLDNPWQIFAPRPDVLYFFPAESGGVMLSVADLSHGHPLDSLTLSQAHSLALSDLSHAHTLDAVSLGQAHALSLADLLHAHSLGATTLTAQGSLSVADATHGHALDAVTLTQAHVLAVSGLDHAHALDSVTLAAQGSLSVADLAHSHALDAPALTQAHVLAVSDATHAHALDALVLVYGDTLSPADLAHAHAMDAPTLTQAHLLALADLLHAHTADALALGYAAELVVSDLLHAHLLDRSNVYQGVLEVHLDPRRMVAVAPENRFFIIQRERRITIVAPQSFLRTQ